MWEFSATVIRSGGVSGTEVFSISIPLEYPELKAASSQGDKIVSRTW